MATLTVGKILASEGAPVVVAGGATPRSRNSKMLCGSGRCDLSGLRQSGFDRVAVHAIKSGPLTVCGVAKAHAEGFRIRRCLRVATLGVAGAAGSDVSPRRLRAGRMTFITIGVRAEPL